MDRQLFDRHVRNVLTHLYDPVYLQTHPLAKLLDLTPSATGSLGESLRQALWEAVDVLKPSAAVPSDQPAWISYNILWQHYLDNLSIEETCQAMGLSNRSFRRYQKSAIEAVAGVLWLRCPAKDDSLPPTTPTPESDSLSAARRFAQNAIYRRCQLRDIAQDICDTIQPLAERMALALDFNTVDAEIHGDPALSAQTALNVLSGVLPAVLGTRLAISGDVAGDQLIWRLAPMEKDALQAALAFSPEVRVGRLLLEVCGGHLSWQEHQSETVLSIVIPMPKPQVVLAVDDDPETTALYARFLRSSYLVEEVSSVAEAHLHLAQIRPDVILLDVLMPHQDGWKLLRSLRSDPAFEPIPIIVCSVLSQPSLAFAQGANRVLQKPISPNALLETIREVLAPPNSRPPQPPASLSAS